MIQTLRKFSVKVSDDLIEESLYKLTADKEYPVLVISGPADDVVLISNDLEELTWIEFDDCQVASIDD